VLTAVAQDNLDARSTSAPVFISASLPATLSIGDQSVVEGNTGTNATFTISLASPSCRTVVVEVVTLDGTASNRTDYLAVRTNLVFVPDELSKQVIVPVIGDLAIEANETFFVCLTNVINASTDRACATALS